MELPHIGKTCSNQECKRLDFLPLQCSCSAIFCGDHFMNHVISCPDSKREKPSWGADEDSATALKVTTGCFTDGCKIRSYLPCKCEKCGYFFCLAHRFHPSCDVSEEEKLRVRRQNEEVKKSYENAVKAVEKEISTKIEKSRKTAKNSSIANKVNLMRLKNRAVGESTIAASERLYFTIKYGLANSEKAIFVSKNHSLGRVIDSIARFCDVENRNNVTNAPKLRLFKDEAIISDNLAVKCDDLLSDGRLENGDVLVLKHQ